MKPPVAMRLLQHFSAKPVGGRVDYSGARLSGWKHRATRSVKSTHGVTSPVHTAHVPSACKQAQRQRPDCPGVLHRPLFKMTGQGSAQRCWLTFLWPPKLTAQAAQANPDQSLLCSGCWPRETGRVGARANSASRWRWRRSRASGTTSPPRAAPSSGSSSPRQTWSPKQEVRMSSFSASRRWLVFKGVRIDLGD